MILDNDNIITTVDDIVVHLNVSIEHAELMQIDR